MPGRIAIREDLSYNCKKLRVSSVMWGARATALRHWTRTNVLRIGMEDLMYKSFSVKNFRGFDDLHIEPLGRVNLIAGRNNVGKTALLEALFILQGATNPELPIRMNMWRHVPPSKEPIEGWGPLFRNLDLGAPIRISSVDLENRTRKLVIEFVEAKESVIPLVPPTEVSAPAGATGPFEARVEGGELVFVCTDELGKTVRGRALLERDGVRIERPQEGYVLPGIFQAARREAPEDAERFSRLEVEGRQEQVLSALRIIEPRLKRLMVVPAPDGPKVYGDIGLVRAVPVSLIGEGIARMLSMVLAFPHVEKGLALIDEVENGLHYTVMAEVWKVIAEFARKYDVQVFATTHSEECIRSAHVAFEELGPDDFRLHRLIRRDGKITAMTYDHEMLAAALDTGLEVR